MLESMRHELAQYVSLLKPVMHAPATGKVGEQKSARYFDYRPHLSGTLNAQGGQVLPYHMLFCQT